MVAACKPVGVKAQKSGSSGSRVVVVVGLALSPGLTDPSFPQASSRSHTLWTHGLVFLVCSSREICIFLQKTFKKLDSLFSDLEGKPTVVS